MKNRDRRRRKRIQIEKVGCPKLGLKMDSSWFFTKNLIESVRILVQYLPFLIHTIYYIVQDKVEVWLFSK